MKYVTWKNFDIIAFIAMIFFIVAYRYFGWLSVLHHCYETSHIWSHAHFWLVSPAHEGLGGLSYLSLTTGLNIAIVKFEAFKKSNEEFKANWQAEADKMARERFPTEIVDDELRDKLKTYISNRSAVLLENGYETHLSRAIFWREVALRLAVVGSAALFVQCSVGVFGLILFAPVIGIWLSKEKCWSNFKLKMDRVIDAAEEYKGMQEATSQQTKQSAVRGAIDNAKPPSGIRGPVR